MGMSKIQELYDKYHGMEIGQISLDQSGELREKLESFCVGDLITLEDHQKFLEILALFRQYNLRSMSLAGKRLVATLESLLSVGEDGVYSNGQRFLYELIQNVDDCYYENPEDCNLEIRFDPQRGTIILTYNEIGFSPKNVFGITGIAEESKNISADKVDIGEKGIGFKSVFGIASKVIIESGFFAFELTKENFVVPVPRYCDYTPVKGTRLTLQMPASACEKIYRDLVEEYGQKESLLNKNPILFLKQLTHLKLYIDGFRYIDFSVTRSAQTRYGEICFEDNVIVAVDIRDSCRGIDRNYISSIPCMRYSMSIIYGKEECVSRYGENINYSERLHNLVAVFPKIQDDNDRRLRKTGVLYSFLPTQVKTTVPMVLHVPFKLDGSREYVDSEKQNRWFVFTLEKLQEFLVNVYTDLAKRVQEDIVSYIPVRHGYLFDDSAETNRSLCVPGTKADAITSQKVFRSADGSFESAKDIVAFAVQEKIVDQITVYNLLGETKKLFVPRYPMDMSLFGCTTISDVKDKLFLRAIDYPTETKAILDWVDANEKEYPYRRLIEKYKIFKFTKEQLIVIARHKECADEFRAFCQRSIRANGTSTIELKGECDQIDDSVAEVIYDVTADADLADQFKAYLKKTFGRYKVIPVKNGDFVLPMSNAVVLARDAELSSFSALAAVYDPNHTVSAALNFRQASARLNKADNDDSIDSQSYLKLLRAERKKLKDAFGDRMYTNYIRSINEAGADPNRFLNELLQNADDVYYADDVIPTFKLSVNASSLRVEYNETGFTKQNVRAITAIGESTKKLLLEDSPSRVIGEKGVGFKSVFGVAKKVSIFSNGFNFSLSEAYPTIPVAEKSDVDGDLVGTVMQFEMKTDVSKTFTDKRILRLCLCLRHLKKLSIGGTEVEIVDKPDQREIHLNGRKYVFKRVVYKFIVKHETALYERNRGGKVVGPEQMIICYMPKKKTEIDEYYLYSGLPTEIKCLVPIVIDAPFELTTSRQGVLHNTWNDIVRIEVYAAIQKVINTSRELGIDVLKYVGFKIQNGRYSWNNFDGDEYLNGYSWAPFLKERAQLPYLGKKETATVPRDIPALIIPDFIAKLQGRIDIAQMFSWRVLDTVGKSQYIPLLEAIGCKKVSGNSIFMCLKKVVPSEMENEEFRNDLYAYLSKKQGNIAFEGIGKNVIELPILPIRRADAGNTYIKYEPNKLFFHPSEKSKDGYYILDTKVLSVTDCDAVLGGFGRVNELTQEVFDAKYINTLRSVIQNYGKVRSRKEIAEYLLGEFKRNRTQFDKCLDTLRGRLYDIPMKMACGEYYTGKKFTNREEISFSGTILPKFVVDEKYDELAASLGCTDVIEIRYSDLEADLDYDEITVEDEDLEDFQCGFKYYSEIVNGFVCAGLIDENQVQRYDLQFAMGVSSDNLEYEDFPEEKVKDFQRLKNHIQIQWRNPNRFIETKVIHWRPERQIDAKNYTLNRYQSRFNRNMCFCQMCEQMHPVTHIERNSVRKNPAFAWEQMSLCLCLNCSKDYVLLRNNAQIYAQFVDALMNVRVADDGNYSVAIGEKTICFTAIHLAEVQEIMRTEGWGNKTPQRIPKLGNSQEDSE